MEELGVGGFMGVQDVREGMKISISINGSSAGKQEYIGEVVERVENTVYVDLEGSKQIAIDKKDISCQLRIVVDNVLYCWEDVLLHQTKGDESGKYKLVVDTNPRVFNRRKYPRMPLSNPCTIRVKGGNETFHGRMVNISANGFAFACRDNAFADIKGRNVTVDVSGFDVLRGKALDGSIIRSSNNSGEYIVGCRMPQDSETIKEYVGKSYSE